MPLLVTMHVYSGVPDPHWIISGNEEQELRRLAAAATAPGRSPHEAGGLGYRGFTVIDTDPDHAARDLFRVQPATGAATDSAAIAGLPDVEDYLLWTGHGHVPDVLAAHAQQSLQPAATAPPPPPPPPKCPPCHAKDAPLYNPTIWNTPQHQPHNNCYNYANNQMTDTFAQPGRATGHQYTAFTCASVRPAAQSDGLAPCANFIAPLAVGAGWYVALVIWPGNDYHWYRQDTVGCWSHKPGGTAARNTDNSGHAIADPRTCNRGPYTVFCTFMITKRTVHIK